MRRSVYTHGNFRAVARWRTGVRMAHTGDVNAVILQRGRDRKLYPAGLPRPAAELARIRRLEHALVCRDRLSIRQCQATLLNSYMIRRSLGAIFKDLRNFECPECAGRG